jgi:galactose oxidase-like protein
MAYDARTKNVVLFGGLVEQNVRLGDTWSWDGSHWTQLSPAHSPSARYNAAIAYDAGRGVVVLHGGSNGDLSDTWTWDGTDWTEIHPAAHPAPLRNGTISMDYDAALDRLVLFGVGQPVDGYSFQTETWTWNGRDWKELSPSRSPSIETISGRAFTMAYYPPTSSLILLAATTWVFDGSTWKPVATSGISPTGERSNMSYDTSTASLVLLNGDRFNGTMTDPRFNDTWTWKGASWTRLSPVTSPPQISGDFTIGPSMTYDAAHGLIVVFGGMPSVGNGGSNVVWTWDGTTWTRVG